jgi:hypothetical protein
VAKILAKVIFAIFAPDCQSCMGATFKAVLPMKTGQNDPDEQRVEQLSLLMSNLQQLSGNNWVLFYAKRYRISHATDKNCALQSPIDTTGTECPICRQQWDKKSHPASFFMRDSIAMEEVLALNSVRRLYLDYGFEAVYK